MGCAYASVNPIDSFNGSLSIEYIYGARGCIVGYEPDSRAVRAHSKFNLIISIITCGSAGHNLVRVLVVVVVVVLGTILKFLHFLPLEGA